MSNESQDLLDVPALAKRIGIAPQTIYNRIANPRLAPSMPPRVYIPNCARVLFRPADVDAWLKGLVSGYASAKGKTQEQAVPKRGRGRPRKSEALARSRYGQDS